MRKTLQRRNVECRKANFARTTRRPPRCSGQSLRAKVEIGSDSTTRGKREHDKAKNKEENPQ